MENLDAVLYVPICLMLFVQFFWIGNVQDFFFSILAMIVSALVVFFAGFYGGMLFATFMTFMSLLWMGMMFGNLTSLSNTKKGIFLFIFELIALVILALIPMVQWALVIFVTFNAVGLVGALLFIYECSD